MNTEQKRADFEAWAIKERIAYRDEKHGVCFYNGERNSYWIGYQAGRAALQSHDSEVWLNRLISLAVSYGDSRHFEVEADDKRDAACRSAQAFKNLIDHARALQSQDREDVKRPVLDSIVDEIHRRADKEWADDGYDFEVTITADEYKALCEEEKAIDHARSVEGGGE